MGFKEDPKVNTVHAQDKCSHTRSRNQLSLNRRAENCRSSDYLYKMWNKGHTGLEQWKCPAIGKRCSKCKLNDHFAAQCRITKKGYKNKKNVHTVDDYSSSEQFSDDKDSLYVGIVIELSSVEYDIDSLSQDWIIHGEVQGKAITMQLDTGAKCNVISRATYEDFKLSFSSLEKSAKLMSYSGHTLKTVGVATVIP